MILAFNGKFPKLHPTVFVAPSAEVIGDVEIGAGSSVWLEQWCVQTLIKSALEKR